MLASHGFFQLKTEDMDKLAAFLASKANFGEIRRENGLLTVFLKEEMEAAEFNRLLFSQGIVLSHLVKRKESLEEQFLALTKNQPSENRPAHETIAGNRVHQALE